MGITSSSLGTESLVSSLIFRRPSVTGSPDIFSCRATVGRHFLTTFGGMSPGCCAGGRPRCLVRLLFKRCSSFLLLSFFTPGHYSDPCVLLLTVKERPDLDNKFNRRVQAAVKHAATIEDFNELIDPRSLARHCLGPEPSLYVLSALDREEKKRKLP